MGKGVLSLNEKEAEFEIEYQYPYKRNEKSAIYYGRDTYQKVKRKLFLAFEDVFKGNSEISLEKIRDSDTLIVILNSAIDLQDSDTLRGISFNLKNIATGDVFTANDSEPRVVESIQDAPRGTKKPLKKYLPSCKYKLEASFIGYRQIEIDIANNGVYRADVKLAVADFEFKSGDRKIFIIHRYEGDIYIRSKDNRKIFFTNKSCYWN